MKNILLILLIIPFLCACPNDDDEPGTTPTPPEELVTRTWQVDSVKVNGSSLDASNYSFRFSDDNSFIINAPDVDDPDFPASGSWVFNSNATKIILNDDVDLDVIQLTEEDFILEYSYSNFKEGTVEFRFEMIPA